MEVPLADGTSKGFSFQNPLAWLAYNCKHSPHFSSLVKKALSEHPCTPSTPWNLIIYQDGVDPSDGLAKNHSRKSAVFYWSFKEFGMSALAHEEVWGVISVARYQEHQQFDGGVSRLFEKVLELFFNDTHDLMRAGVSIEIDGSHVVIFGRASILLADIPAIKECLLFVLGCSAAQLSKYSCALADQKSS